MNNRTPITQIVSFLIYFLVQIVLFRDVWLWGYAFCLIYVAPLLLLPTHIKTHWLLIIAFLVGICIDIFYNKLGMNTAACVFLAYLRPKVIRLLENQGAADDVKEFNIQTLGIGRFSLYAVILLGAHHLLLFLIDGASAGFIARALLKTLASTGFTFIILLSFQMIYHARRRRR